MRDHEEGAIVQELLHRRNYAAVAASCSSRLDEGPRGGGHRSGTTTTSRVGREDNLAPGVGGAPQGEAGLEKSSLIKEPSSRRAEVGEQQTTTRRLV
jgi:hypothetical protein